MIELGINHVAIRTMITAKRDTGEPLWIFKQRFGLGLPLKAYANAGPIKAPETDTQRVQRIRLQREQAERERQAALTPEQRSELLRRAARGIGEMEQS